MKITLLYVAGGDAQVSVHKRDIHKDKSVHLKKKIIHQFVLCCDFLPDGGKNRY